MLDERWSPEADEIGEALRRLLAAESSPEKVRAAEQRPHGRDMDLERHLAEFGLDELELEPDVLARISYELGRALAPGASVEAMPARIVLGSPLTSCGFEGPVPASLPQVAVRREDGDVYVEPVNGVPRKTTAGDWIVDHLPGGGGGVRMGSSSHGDRMLRLAALVESARMVGAGQALLGYGAAYAREREQFGRPIGAYQGVAHRLANAATALDGAELLVRKAAFTALDRAGGDGAPAPIFALMLRPKAIEAARFTTTTVHQVFGGNGFAMEYDVQLYSRRIRSWANRGGRTGPDLADIGRMVLDPTRRDGLTYLWHYEVGMPLPRWAREADKLAG